MRTPDVTPKTRRFFFSLCMMVLWMTSILSCSRSAQEQKRSEVTDSVSEMNASGELRKVRLMPYWVTSAQFAGYYIGIEKGIFKKHGIDLKILPFDPTMDFDLVIRNKSADFILLWLVNALKIRDKGIDIVNIAQFSYRSSLMLITKKSSGINTLSKMNGKRAGIWLGYELQPKALFRKYNLDVTIVPIGSTNNLFLLDGVDILNANWFDEYHAILNNGYNEDELHRFFFADYGLNFLEDGLYCLSETLAKNPQLCVDFVAATLESWNYAFKNQDEAVESVIKYAKKNNYPVNASHQRWMLRHYQSLYIPKGKQEINTVLPRKDYEMVGQIMKESGLVQTLIPYELFYHPYNKLGMND